MLEETLKEVSKLSKNHLVEIKSFANPPEAVRVVLGGVVLLNHEKIIKEGG